MTKPRDKSLPDTRETILYLATCRKTGKQYIGITKQSLRIRVMSHFCNAKTKNGVLQNAIRKYGNDAFTFEHIASGLTWEDGCALERQLILQYGSLIPDGYNTLLNSNSKPRSSNREEHNQKISAAMKIALTPEWHSRCVAASLMPEVRERVRFKLRGRKPTPEQIEKARMANTGRKQSAETIAKRVLKLKGKKKTPESIEKTRQAHLGKKLSDEHRRKISQIQTGRLLKKETKEKLSVAMSGRQYSEEHRRNISEARKGMKFSEEHLRNLTIANRENARKRREAALSIKGEACHV